MHSLTTEEWTTLQNAWPIWEKLQQDLQVYLTMKYRATGKWISGGDCTFISDIDKTGIETTDVEAHDDGDWDSITCMVTADELLNLESLHTTNTIISETVTAQRTAEQEARAIALRKQQWEALSKEFGV
jgi:hypothetical protein